MERLHKTIRFIGWTLVTLQILAYLYITPHIYQYNEQTNQWYQEEVTHIYYYFGEGLHAILVEEVLMGTSILIARHMFILLGLILLYYREIIKKMPKKIPISLNFKKYFNWIGIKNLPNKYFNWLDIQNEGVRRIILALHLIAFPFWFYFFDDIIDVDRDFEYPMMWGSPIWTSIVLKAISWMKQGFEKDATS